MPLFTTKAGARGTGLGLSLVRRLIDRHAGVIRVRSAPGAGTCFSMLLPAAGGTTRPQRAELAELRGPLHGDDELALAPPRARAVQ